MKTGTINNLITYFFEEEKYSSDIKKALKDFFKLKNINELIERVPDFGDVNSRAHRYFHEWFVFDFKLASGRTPLSEWYTLNPHQLSSFELSVYADLQANNFGYFEVISSVPGRVEVKSLSNGDIYNVREYKAAPFLIPKEIIIARVAHIEGRYEFVSGLLERTDTEFSDKVKALFYKEGRPQTLKDIYHLYCARDDKDNATDINDEKTAKPGQLILSIPEARHNLHQALKKCDILPFVSAQKVEKWMRSDPELPKTFTPVTILLGLASEDSEEKDIQELLNASTALNNAIRSEKRLITNEQAKEKPRFIQDIINPFEWRDIYHDGIESMKQGLFPKALKEFTESFQYLLEQQTTTREIYRLFANKGTVMLAIDPMSPRGRYFLELALKLNPNYDFAREQLKRRDHFFISPRDERQWLNKGNNDKKILGLLARTMEQIIVKGRNSARALDLKDDPAYIYYEWLKNLEICFSKHIPVTTKEVKIKQK